MSETAETAATTAAVTEQSTQRVTEQVANESEPNWLPARLARQEKSIAKRLGAETIEEIEARLAKARELEQERMSEVERLRARTKELESAAKERDELRSSVAAQAAEAMAALTPEQREAVEDLAEGSPAKQLKAIAKLRPTWKANAPVPAPATTAVAAPPPAQTNSQATNHLATWERLKKTNPIEAAYYLDRYQIEISEARKARQ